MFPLILVAAIGGGMWAFQNPQHPIVSEIREAADALIASSAASPTDDPVVRALSKAAAPPIAPWDPWIDPAEPQVIRFPIAKAQQAAIWRPGMPTGDGAARIHHSN